MPEAGPPAQETLGWRAGRTSVGGSPTRQAARISIFSATGCALLGVQLAYALGVRVCPGYGQPLVQYPAALSEKRCLLLDQVVQAPGERCHHEAVRCLRDGRRLVRDFYRDCREGRVDGVDLAVVPSSALRRTRWRVR